MARHGLFEEAITLLEKVPWPVPDLCGSCTGPDALPCHCSGPFGGLKGKRIWPLSSGPFLSTGHWANLEAMRGEKVWTLDMRCRRKVRPPWAQLGPKESWACLALPEAGLWPSGSRCGQMQQALREVFQNKCFPAVFLRRARWGKVGLIPRSDHGHHGP